jgi:hypothetical protein
MHFIGRLIEQISHPRAPSKNGIVRLDKVEAADTDRVDGGGACSDGPTVKAIFERTSETHWAPLASEQVRAQENPASGSVVIALVSS